MLYKDGKGSDPDWSQEVEEREGCLGSDSKLACQRDREMWPTVKEAEVTDIGGELFRGKSVRLLSKCLSFALQG